MKPGNKHSGCSRAGILPNAGAFDTNNRSGVVSQFEDDDGGVCYIETHDHDTYTGHFRLRLIEFTPTRLAFEIARADHKYIEVTYDLDAERFGEVQRIVHIVWRARMRRHGDVRCVWSHKISAFPHHDRT